MYERGIPGPRGLRPMSQGTMQQSMVPVPAQSHGDNYWPAQVSDFSQASEYSMGWGGMAWHGVAYDRSTQVVPQAPYPNYPMHAWGHSPYQQHVMGQQYHQGAGVALATTTHINLSPDAGRGIEDQDAPGSGACTPDEVTMPAPATPNFAATSPPNQPSPVHFGLPPLSMPASAKGAAGEDSALGQDIQLAVSRFLECSDQGIPTDSDGENTTSAGGVTPFESERSAAGFSTRPKPGRRPQHIGVDDSMFSMDAYAGYHRGWEMPGAEPLHRHQAIDHRWWQPQPRQDTGPQSDWWRQPQPREDTSHESDNRWWLKLNSEAVKEAVAREHYGQREPDWWESEAASQGGAQASAPKHRAAWAKAVRIKDGGETIKVSMSNWALTDADMVAWCEWFSGYLRTKIWKDAQTKILYAQDVDFSRNKLTSAGIRPLLQTLWDNSVSVITMKLHHNKIESAEELVGLFHDGNLRELHLSHNRLDNGAATEIIKAAATAKDENGAFRYPWKESDGRSAPLWLRLEQNSTEAAALSSTLDMLKRKLKRREGLTCILDGRKGCTPHACMVHTADPPALHIMYTSSGRPQYSAEHADYDASWEEADWGYGRGAKYRGAARDSKWQQWETWGYEDDTYGETPMVEPFSETSKSSRRRAATRQKRPDSKPSLAGDTDSMKEVAG